MQITDKAEDVASKVEAKADEAGKKLSSSASKAESKADETAKKVENTAKDTANSAVSSQAVAAACRVFVAFGAVSSMQKCCTHAGLLVPSAKHTLMGSPINSASHAVSATLHAASQENGSETAKSEAKEWIDK